MHFHFIYIASKLVIACVRLQHWNRFGWYSRTRHPETLHCPGLVQFGLMQCAMMFWCGHAWYTFTKKLFLFSKPCSFSFLSSFQISCLYLRKRYEPQLEQCKQFSIFLDPNMFLHFVYNTWKVRITWVWLQHISQGCMDFIISPHRGQRLQAKSMSALFRMAGSGCPPALRNDLASLQDYVCVLKRNTAFRKIIRELGEPVDVFFLAEHGTCGIRKLDTLWAEYIKSANQVRMRVDGDIEELLSKAYLQSSEKCAQYQRVRAHLLSLKGRHLHKDHS